MKSVIKQLEELDTYLVAGHYDDRFVSREEVKTIIKQARDELARSLFKWFEVGTVGKRGLNSQEMIMWIDEILGKGD